MIEEFEILKCTRDEKLEKLLNCVKVVVETPLTIIVNDNEYITIMCTPIKMEELAVGFLFSGRTNKIKRRYYISNLESSEENICRVRIKNHINFEELYGIGLLPLVVRKLIL